MTPTLLLLHNCSCGIGQAALSVSGDERWHRAETPRMEFADLDEAGMNRVCSLEQDIGGCVLALQRRVDLRDLSQEELEKLQSAEQELGVVLMAHDCE